MKKIIHGLISIFILIAMFITPTSGNTTITSKATDNITIYAPDGRIAAIPTSDVKKYLDVGWYDYPVTVMYAPDGRTEIISTSAVADWESVGWIDGNKTVMMYAPDGRTATIKGKEVSAWKNVGWYDYPVTIVYAPDGRTEIISTSAVADWESVGWIDGNKTVMMYAPDGRTATIKGKEVTAWKSVGWYDYPVMKLYSSSGKTSIVYTGAVNEWKKSGWLELHEYLLGQSFDWYKNKFPITPGFSYGGGNYYKLTEYDCFVGFPIFPDTKTLRCSGLVFNSMKSGFPLLASKATNNRLDIDTINDYFNQEASIYYNEFGFSCYEAMYHLYNPYTDTVYDIVFYCEDKYGTVDIDSDVDVYCKKYV